MDESAMDLRGAVILVIDDVLANLDVLCQALEETGYQIMVASSGERALDLVVRRTPDLVLLDVVMPGVNGFEVCRLLKQGAATRAIPVIFLTALGDPTDLVEGFDAGGVDYVVKPFHMTEVLVRIRTHLEKARLERDLREKNAALEKEIAEREILTRQRDQLNDRLALADQREAQRWGLNEFVGHSSTLNTILDEINLLQDARHISVLIEGESGTGKELVARAIHAGSARREKPFVAVNCAAIPRELADSLLFGHVRGAFTGADKEQTGYFELADGGVLFLDEIGILPPELQPKLLRVLEERAVQPLGARAIRPLDVRVLAATNEDLAAAAQSGAFRQDLYFRLAHYTVRVPPLRERRDDIALLVRHFLQLFAAEMSVATPALSDAALARLEAYAFPGNVRELKSILERALIASRGEAIQPEHLHLLEPTSQRLQTVADEEVPLNLEQAELVLIRRALKQSNGNIAAAARLLGTNRARIYRRLEQIPEAERSKSAD